ncbi:MAG: valine--tRNA ligase [Acidobacteriota bacterium]
MTELPKQYNAADHEDSITRRWQETGAFDAAPRRGVTPYVIMMPLPNVTGALHMGHAMDNVMQDLLTRWHRMQGEMALWMPGVDHAGIATQAVVEKRLFELEGKTRHDIGRDDLVARIWEWSARYRERIISQQQAMGCGCDWRRHRYTMDRVCRRAVYWTFFAMFRDGLIFQGDRMVNWDCHLQTAIADDEIVRQSVNGHFWHLRYPVIDPRPGEPADVVVATTRPETLLGDTAVACHPDPAAALQARIAKTQERLDRAGPRDRAALQSEMDRLTARQASHLPMLEQLRGMARDGRQVMLPLLDRPLPLIADAWARPELGSGCVKITPAHDPNDHEVWQRHRDRIDLINILNPDGTLNEAAGPYAGLDRDEARRRVVADLEDRNAIDHVEDREVELGLSDRSKTIIEPYMSRQWFVRMGDVEDGVTCGRGTPHAFQSRGLAQAAIDAADGTWTSPSGRQVAFHPDERYRSTYLTWLAEKRDWCISRQLWWGHRIPIWSAKVTGDNGASLTAALDGLLVRDEVCARLATADGTSRRLAAGDPLTTEIPAATGSPGPATLQVCVRDPDTVEEVTAALERAGLIQDPDVLDTWFSSGVWPHSTLGWPDPTSAEIDPGQPPLGGTGGETDCVDFFYPGSCLVTGRDIITLWIVRMVVMGLYNLGDVPFTDVFIHANILDGKGERMSKSKGNGIDPVDIIKRYGTDAMRYVLCEMQTGTQDIRLPVQAISPFTGHSIDLATARHGSSVFTYICPESGKEFDVLGTMPDLPAARLVSDRFDVGRNFCNKLWNAARFALMNLDGATFTPRRLEDLADEDRWLLSRLSHVCEAVQEGLQAYNPAAAMSAAREFFWGDLCDWYLEIIKPRLWDDDTAGPARQVLALALDQVLRLLHPFIPFVTEVLWEKLNGTAPSRGLTTPLPVSGMLATSAWPRPDIGWQDPSLEEGFHLVQQLIRAIRDIRSMARISPARRLTVRVRATGATAAGLGEARDRIIHMAHLDGFTITSDAARTPDAATAMVADAEVMVSGVVDPAVERDRLTRQRQALMIDLDRARKKLGNEKFTSRARPEIVEQERARAVELETRLRTLDASLRLLDSSS